MFFIRLIPSRAASFELLFYFIDIDFLEGVSVDFEGSISAAC